MWRGIKTNRFDQNYTALGLNQSLVDNYEASKINNNKHS